MPELITLTIDGREVKVEKGRTILDAALKLGIIIPTFCWDPRLNPIAACRMCLVEVEKSPKPIPSCAAPALDGMVVKVFSEKAIEARKRVLEYILVNHPLDCPTCDKGGECVLQDHTFDHGPDHTRTEEPRNRTVFDRKFAFDDVPLGPIVWLNMNRCIQCFKCTRIIKEIAGDADLGAFNRGYRTIIHRHQKRPFRSEFSGNTVENCPVGALVADSFRYKVRTWLLKRTPSVCHLCGDGCNTTLWHQGQKLFRIYSRWNRNVDNGLICDRGRFGGLFADSDRRLQHPKIRKEGKLQDVTWDEALDYVADKLSSAHDINGAKGIGVIGNEMTSNEEAYLLSRFARQVIGTNNIDFRFEDRFTPSPELNRKILGLLKNRIPFTEFENFNNLVILGADAETRHPVMTLWIKKAIKEDNSKCFAAYHRKTDFTLFPVNSLEYFPQGEYNFLLALYNALKGNNIEELAAPAGVASSKMQTWVDELKNGKTLLFAGEDLYNNPRGNENIDLLKGICRLLGEDSKLNILFDGSNYLGNLLWGCTPDILPDGMENNQKNRQHLAEEWGAERIADEPGMNTTEMLKSAADGSMGAILFYGSDPVGFYPDRELAANAVKSAAFKVAIETFLTETGKTCDVVLPLAAFPEYDGSIISTEGRIQYFEKAYKSAYSSAEGWKILLRLMQRLDFESDYREPADIWAEMSEDSKVFGKKVYKGMRFGGIFLDFDFDEPPYADVTGFKSDGAPSPDENRPFILTYGSSVYQRRHLTYYAESMEKIDPGPKLYMNPDNAAKINLNDNDTVRISSEYSNLTMRMTVDENIRPGTVFIPVNYPEAEVSSLLSSSSDLTFVKVEKL